MVRKIIDQRFVDVITEWQRHLLQMDRRNNLLYFKTGKTSVHIIEQTPTTIMKALQSSRKGLTFDYAETIARISKRDTRSVAG